ADTPVDLAVGANTITIVVTAQDGTTTKTYTVTVTRTSASASSNADLSDLTLSGVTLSPSFAVATTSYSATVANSVSSLTVTPSASTANASITVNGSSAASAVHLSVGANRITIVVTAQDGTTKTYTVTVTRIGEADVEITQSYRLVKEPTKTGPLTTLAALTNTLSLTITVYNHGPDAVTGVVVTDSFPEAAVGTVWTWTCVETGGGVCGNANGTGNLNETLGLLPKDGSVTFVVTGSLLNPNNWRNTPGLVTPTGVVNTSSGNPPVIVGNFLIFFPIVMR
ncbi:MAG: cadherin-like beta sandwich domain-containing protein, partial [Chloroflexales bacterium]